MTLTYRNAGAWGAGKGGPLTVAEADNNIYTLKQAIDAIAADVPDANNIIGFTQSGPLLTLTLSNGDELGPITLPVAPYAPPNIVTVSTATFAPTISAVNTFTECTNVTECVVTIPTTTTVAFAIGTELHFAQAAAGPVVIEGAVGVTIVKRADRDASTDAVGAVLTAKKIASNTWRIFGDLAVTP